MSIYTKTGDSGNTTILAGKKIKKSNEIIQVLGDLDELNASLGTAVSFSSHRFSEILRPFQMDIFDMGSYIAGMDLSKKASERFLSKINKMEKIIDKVDKKNKNISTFIVPGGTQTSALLHFSRTICRRAERGLVDCMIKKKKKSHEVFVAYLNRLSDLLFVLARSANNHGKKDVIWKNSEK